MLIRKLLAYKHRPAVIVLHWWSPQTRKFWESAEDELEVFSKYALVATDAMTSFREAADVFCMMVAWTICCTQILWAPVTQLARCCS